jgi:predicted RNase H-like nuclease (RuvC/YqgF family)
MIEQYLYLAIGILLGLFVGLCIDKNARYERDERIRDLESELVVKQNVADALNETVNRLRRENEKLKKKNKED